MTADKITARITELQNLAKQHESILLQISGAIQELNNVLAEMSKEKTDAAPRKPSAPDADTSKATGTSDEGGKPSEQPN